MASDHFCLKWNNFHNSIVSAFESLQSSEDLVDVTLMCEGRNVKAHKVILSACSPYFRNLFKETPCQHPIIILKDVLHCDLIAILQFMYQGEVLITQDGLASFLKTAELLQVSGLAGNTPPGASIASKIPENVTVPAPSTQPAPPLVPMPVASPPSPRPTITKPSPEVIPLKSIEKENAPQKEEKQQPQPPQQQQCRFEPETEPIQSCSYQSPESVVIKQEAEDQDFEDMDYTMIGQENIDDPGPATEEQSILERSLKAQGQPLLKQGGYIQKNKVKRPRPYANCPFCNIQVQAHNLNRHLNNTCKERLTVENSNSILKYRTRSGSSSQPVTLQSILTPNTTVLSKPTLTPKPIFTPSPIVTSESSFTANLTPQSAVIPNLMQKSCIIPNIMMIPALTPKPSLTPNHVVTPKPSLVPKSTITSTPIVVSSTLNPNLTLTPESTVIPKPIMLSSKRKSTSTPTPIVVSSTLNPNLNLIPESIVTPEPVVLSSGRKSRSKSTNTPTPIAISSSPTSNLNLTPESTTPKPVKLSMRRKSRSKKMDDFEYY